MSRLSVRGLMVGYGGLLVLRGVELEVADGSLTTILGASGSGKTTLLRAVAGFERAVGGRVAIGGTVVDEEHRHVPAERRRIGYVPQEGALFPHLTVEGNIGFALPRRGRTARVAELIELVGLGGLARRYPHQLSGGQQQRVALARALAATPDLVLLDEPFSSLDAALRAAVRTDVLRVLRAAGTTAVLVTHDQDEALSMADQVAVLRRGVIAQHGSPREVYRHPGDPQLAGFLGEANLLAGTAGAGRVATPLGELELDANSRGLTGAGVVLVRPEQLEIRAVGSAGLPARVVDQDFYGHDAVVRLAPEQPPGGEVLLARVADAPALPLGSLVALAVRGPVTAWPAPPAGGSG